MKKLVIGIMLALVLTTIVPFASASADAGPMDHVVISPATATVPTSGTQSFAAVGQDAFITAVSGDGTVIQYLLNYIK